MPCEVLAQSRLCPSAKPSPVWPLDQFPVSLCFFFAFSTANSFVSPTSTKCSSNPFVSPTYAKTGGGTPLLWYDQSFHFGFFSSPRASSARDCPRAPFISSFEGIFSRRSFSPRFHPAGALRPQSCTVHRKPRTLFPKSFFYYYINSHCRRADIFIQRRMAWAVGPEEDLA
jgi:hypothetical protein